MLHSLKLIKHVKRGKKERKSILFCTIDRLPFVERLDAVSLIRLNAICGKVGSYFWTRLNTVCGFWIRPKAPVCGQYKMPFVESD